MWWFKDVERVSVMIRMSRSALATLDVMKISFGNSDLLFDISIKNVRFQSAL